jgi:regulator of protease activity HflC (stomatin/prohibitin superfamily)
MGLESILGAFAFIVGGYLIGSVRIVDEGEEALVQRLGQYQRTLKPGLNFVVPFMDTVLVESMREQTLDIEPQDVVTLDKASMKVDTIVYWRINDLYSAYYRVEDLEDALKNLVLSALRSEIGQLNLDDAFSDIGSINDNLRQELRSATAAWGVEIMRVEIQKFDLPPELRVALDKQAAAKAEGQADRPHQRRRQIDQTAFRCPGGFRRSAAGFEFLDCGEVRHCQYRDWEKRQHQDFVHESAQLE